MSLISCRCSVSTTLCLSMSSKQCELQAANASPKMLGKRSRRRKSRQVALLSLLLSQATQIRACETRGIGVVFLCVCGERFVSVSARAPIGACARFCSLARAATSEPSEKLQKAALVSLPKAQLFSVPKAALFMLPATFVVGPGGREASFCPLPEDAAGLYVMFFNQGTLHGSKNIRTDAAQLGETVMLPVLFSPNKMSDAVLTTQMLRHMQAHNAVVVAVDCSKKVRHALCRAWQKDLDSLGGKVPAGSPNSSRVGIIRSNGLPFGTFATNTRAHAELRRCWELLAIALGRDDPCPAPPRGASQPAVITSFDGILYTKATDNFTGLKPHMDTYPPPHGETGQLQALAYVHPPPPGVLRLGCAVAFYPAKAHSIWRDYLLALVTRWSTSPDLDLRKSPLPGLGSKTGGGKHRFVLGVLT